MKKNNKIIIIILIVFGCILLITGVSTLIKNKEHISNNSDISKKYKICSLSSSNYSITLKIFPDEENNIDTLDSLEEWKYDTEEDFQYMKEDFLNRENGNKYKIDQKNLTIKLEKLNQKMINLSGEEYKMAVNNYIASLEKVGYNCK